MGDEVPLLMIVLLAFWTNSTHSIIFVQKYSGFLREAWILGDIPRPYLQTPLKNILDVKRVYRKSLIKIDTLALKSIGN